MLALGGTAAQSGILDNLRTQAAADAQRQVTEFLEIANIKLRLLLFGKPGRITYTTFLADGGKPILYIPVSGKCTSSNKRLEAGEKAILLEDGYADKETQYRAEAVGVPSEDGTYGTSAPYVYCFTTNGTYFQWNGKYEESSRPVELTIQPVVLTGLSKEKLH